MIFPDRKRFRPAIYTYELTIVAGTLNLRQNSITSAKPITLA